MGYQSPSPHLQPETAACITQEKEGHKKTLSILKIQDQAAPLVVAIISAIPCINDSRKQFYQEGLTVTHEHFVRASFFCPPCSWEEKLNNSTTSGAQDPPWAR